MDSRSAICIDLWHCCCGSSLEVAYEGFYHNLFQNAVHRYGSLASTRLHLESLGFADEDFHHGLV